MCLSGTICSVFLVPSPRRVSLHSSQKVRRNPPEPCAGIRRGGGKYSGGVFRPKGGVASLQNQKWLPSQARIYLRWSKRAPSPRALLRSSVGGFGFISSAFVRLRFVTDGPARCAAKKRPRTGRGRSPPGGNPPPPRPPHDNPGQRPRAKFARPALDAPGLSALGASRRGNPAPERRVSWLHPARVPAEPLAGETHPGLAELARPAHPRAFSAPASPPAPTPRDGQKTRRRWGNPLLTGVHP